MAKILVVDDCADITASLAMLFEVHGHETCEAANGRECLHAVVRFAPQVVVLDLDMPILDGFSAARELCLGGGAGRPRLVALSGLSGFDVEAQSRAAGFDHFLMKPPDIDEFLKLVNALCECRGLEGSGA